MQRLGIALVLVGVPLMLLAPALPPQSGKWAVHKQDWLLGCLIAAIFAMIVILPNEPKRARKSTQPMLVIPSTRSPGLKTRPRPARTSAPDGCRASAVETAPP